MYHCTQLTYSYIRFFLKLSLYVNKISKSIQNTVHIAQPTLSVVSLFCNNTCPISSVLSVKMTTHGIPIGSYLQTESQHVHEIKLCKIILVKNLKRIFKFKSRPDYILFKDIT